MIARTTERPTKIRWQIVALLMGLCLISHFNRSSMSVAGNDRIMEQFSIAPTRMGAIYSAFLLVYSICMIPGGVFIDRLGPRRALMMVGFGSAFFGALTGVTGWICASSASLLLSLTVVRGMMGLVSTPLHPAAARSISNWFPFAQRSGANGLVTAAAILGVALSYPGFGALIKAVDWPSSFLLSAGMTVILTTLWAFLATDRPAQHPRVNQAERDLAEARPPTDSPDPIAMSPRTHTENTWLTLLVNRDLILVTLSYAAVGYFQYLFVYWMQFYLDKVLHVGATQSKFYASILQVALALGMPMGGWLSGYLAQARGVRIGRALVSGGGMAISAILLGCGVLAQNPIWIVLWFTLAHAAMGASEGPFWATAVDIGGDKGGTSAAICNTGGNLGGLLAPVVTPWVGIHLGWPWAIGVGGVICFLGAFCWCGIDPTRSRR